MFFFLFLFVAPAGGERDIVITPSFGVCACENMCVCVCPSGFCTPHYFYIYAIFML